MGVMMKWLPLLFTVALLDIEAQVQISLRGIEYANSSIVKMEDIGENNAALLCSTDFRPCCGTPPNRYGEWYYPGGSNVRPIGSGDTFYRSRQDDGTVRLHRRPGALPTGGRYRCTVPNNQGRATNIFVEILSESFIPRVTRQPEHVFNADPGSIVSLSVVAINARVYQWQVNDTDLRESTKYNGTRTSALMIHNIDEYDEGLYSCIISSEFVSERSNRASVTVLNSPTIVEDPEDQVGIEEGATVMFSITVVGMKVSFNWMFQNGSLIPTDTKYSGQNTSLLTIFSVTYEDSASYQCQVSNAAGSVVSRPARLSVFKFSQIETFEAVPDITSVLLTWSLDEQSQNTTSYFSLKYFPVLFPNVVVEINTTDARYEAVGLLPQAVYVFELQPMLGEEGASQMMTINVILDKPIPPVENVSAAISSGISVQVSWDMKYELPGWSSLYFIVYYSAYSPDGLRSVHQLFEVNETSINIKINYLVLEADWQHQFQVSAVLAVGVEGLEVIESEREDATLKIELGRAPFQIIIGPIDYCIQWEVEKAKRFQLAIRQKIASVISTSCACDFPLHLIDDGVFSCRTFHNFVTYRSKISGLFASDMIQHLSEWIETSPTLKVEWLLLSIHSTCPVKINSIDDPDCSILSNTTNSGITDSCV